MNYAITVLEVRDGFSTSASTADLEAYIAVVDQADVCLAAKSVPEAVGKQMKVLGVRHLAQNATDGGAVTEEQAVSGARRSYSERKSGLTGYMEALLSIDRYGCVAGVINRNGRVQFRSIGPIDPNLV